MQFFAGHRGARRVIATPHGPRNGRGAGLAIDADVPDDVLVGRTRLSAARPFEPPAVVRRVDVRTVPLEGVLGAFQVDVPSAGGGWVPAPVAETVDGTPHARAVLAALRPDTARGTACAGALFAAAVANAQLSTIVAGAPSPAQSVLALLGAAVAGAI